MTDDERFKLLFGPYRAPTFEYGDVLFCEVRGDLVLCGLTDAPIPWPIGKKRGKGSRGRSIIVSAGLAEAVRRESSQAVAHWWGVSKYTVGLWRRALGVGPSNEGTRRLRHDYFEEPPALAGRRKSVETAGDPARRAKIGAARRGKRQPPHVGAAVAAAHRGKTASAETRRKMSETHRQRSTQPPSGGRPWTAEEDALLRSLPPAEVVRRTGRTPRAVYARRRVLGIQTGG